MQPWQEDNWIEQSQILLNSYRQFLDEELISRNGLDEDQSRAMFEAPFVVVSHGTQDDPILNYGNEGRAQLVGDGH